MTLEEKVMAVLSFLELDAPERDRLLRPHGIRGLTFKRLKLDEKALDRRNRSRLKRSANPIHTDFPKLMDCFKIDLESGLVRIKGSERVPLKMKSGYLMIKDDNRVTNLRTVTPKANKLAWQAIKKG